jgi:hypothetical protein
VGGDGGLVSEDSGVSFEPNFPKDKFREGHPTTFNLSLGLEREGTEGGPIF